MLSAGCSAAWASGFPTQICGVCSLPVIPKQRNVRRRSHARWYWRTSSFMCEKLHLIWSFEPLARILASFKTRGRALLRDVCLKKKERCLDGGVGLDIFLKADWHPQLQEREWDRQREMCTECGVFCDSLVIYELLLKIDFLLLSSPNLARMQECILKSNKR